MDRRPPCTSRKAWHTKQGSILKLQLFCFHVVRKRVYQDVNRKPALYNQKRKVLGQIWALQPKVREAFEKLRTSSRFSADMFLKVRSHETTTGWDGCPSDKVLLKFTSPGKSFRPFKPFTNGHSDLWLKHASMTRHSLSVLRQHFCRTLLRQFRIKER